MKYVLVDWPEIQQYMEHPNYKEKVYYDSEKGVWFVPEEWEDWCPESYYDDTENWEEGYDAWGIGPDIGDLDDAMG